RFGSPARYELIAGSRDVQVAPVDAEAKRARERLRRRVVPRRAVEWSSPVRPHRGSPRGNDSRSMAAATELGRGLHADLVRGRRRAHAAKDGHRVAIDDDREHELAEPNVDEPLLEMRTEQVAGLLGDRNRTGRWRDPVREAVCRT